MIIGTAIAPKIKEWAESEKARIAAEAVVADVPVADVPVADVAKSEIELAQKEKL